MKIEKSQKKKKEELKLRIAVIMLPVFIGKKV